MIDYVRLSIKENVHVLALEVFAANQLETSFLTITCISMGTIISVGILSNMR